jgi:hypothetical protein
MEIQVYNSEKFNKNIRRYIIFGTVCAVAIVVSILYGNLVGAILLFFILGAYFFFSVKNSQPVMMRLTEVGIRVGERIYAWTNLTGYTLEVDANKDSINNIIFLFSNNEHIIHTVDDEMSKVNEFINQLNQYIPLQQRFQQTTMQKLYRRLKL